MIEIFKNIEGYECYQISNHGRVKSLKYGNERILTPIKYNKGYLQVILCKQGKIKHYSIHRLVAQAFLPNPENLPEVNHKDEDKTNNNVTNLEFCDHKYNINYGTHNKRMAEKKSKQVLCVETGKIYNSTMEVERELGFAHTHISSACLGKFKTCGGFHWKYVS